MAGYPTSDRLCRVITKNFLAEHELQQKLNSIEKKKRKASVQISLNRLEIKKELQSIVSPENCKIGPSYAKGKAFDHSATRITDQIYRDLIIP